MEKLQRMEKAQKFAGEICDEINKYLDLGFHNMNTQQKVAMGLLLELHNELHEYAEIKEEAHKGARTNRTEHSNDEDTRRRY